MATDKNGIEIKDGVRVRVDPPGPKDAWKQSFEGSVLCTSPFDGAVCVAELPEERVHWEVYPNQIQVQE